MQTPHLMHGVNISIAHNLEDVHLISDNFYPELALCAYVSR